MKENKSFKRRKKEKAINYRNGSVVMGRNRLQSTALKPRSKKRAQLMREVRGPLVREILEERPWCERGVAARIDEFVTGEYWSKETQINRSTQVHEKLTRARGGDITDKANCVALCRACHGWIHDHPAVATEEGWLEHRKADIDVMPRRY